MTAPAIQTITPKQALEAIQNISTQIGSDPAAQQVLVALANTIALSAPSWALNAMKRDAELLKEVTAIKAAVVTIAQALKGRVSAPDVTSPDEAGQQQQQSQDNTSSAPPSERLDAMGNPMDPDQAALEDLMDSATSGLAPHPGMGGDAPAPSTPDEEPNNYPPVPDQEPAPAHVPERRQTVAGAAQGRRPVPRANGTASTGPAAPKA